MPESIISIKGHVIGPRELQRSMRINILAGSLGMMWFAMTTGMPLVMFMEALGSSGVLIGMIATVRLLAMGVQIPTAMISENLGERKKFWGVLALATRALWIVPALLALFWQPSWVWLPVVVVLFVAVNEILGQASTAPWLSWMTDLIPVKSSGRFWGVRQTIVMAAALTGMSVAGYLLDLYRHPQTGAMDPTGFAIVFGLAALLGIADVLVHMAVAEPRPGAVARDQSMGRRVLAPLRDRNFRLLTLSLGCWSFGAAMIGSFGVVYLKREFGATYTDLAVLAVVASLGAMLTSILFGHLVDRFGARLMAVILLVTAPLTGFGWFFVTGEQLSWVLPWVGRVQITQAILVQGVATFFAGSLFSALGLCQMRLVAALSSASGRTMSVALHWSVLGLVAALGPVAGGAVMDLLEHHPVAWVMPTGSRFSFFHVLVALFTVVVWGLALPLMLRMRVPR